MNEIPIAWLTDETQFLDGKIDKLLNDLRSRKAKLLEVHKLKEEVEALARKLIPDLQLEKIMDAVAAEFRVDLSHLVSKSREQHVATPRQVAFYIARSQTGLSLNVIGKAFGRDHGTVIHGCKAIQDLMDTDEDFANRTRQIMGRLKLGK